MKKRLWLFILCLCVPFVFVGCESLNKDYLSTPKNLVVEADGLITFERVDKDEYYVIRVNELEQNVFVATANPYMELYNKNGVNYLQYDISRMLNLGESYSIQVKACASKKKDSAYTKAISYVHQVHIDTPETQIVGNTLTWNNVYNASSYIVKVVTPSTPIEADDPDTIANAPNVFSSQYSLNKFDFASMLTEAGEFKFYVKAISRDNNYLESSFSPKIVYYNYVNLATPQNLELHKIDNDWILTCVLDQYTNNLQVDLNGKVELLDILDSSITRDEICDNLIYVNLNKAFKSKNIDFDNLTTVKVSCKAVYGTQAQNYYTNSNWSKAAELTIKSRLEAPTLTLNANTNILSWPAVESENVAGYRVYVYKSTGVEQSLLAADCLNFELPTDFVSVAVQTVAQGNVESSVLSEFKHNGENQTENIGVQLQGNNLVWGEIENAYYIVETNKEILVLNTNQLNLLSLNYLVTEVKVTAIVSNKNSNTATLKPSYKVQLGTPQNAGFVSSNKYLLSFDAVNNAIGYKVYITDLSQETNQAVCINQLFVSNRVDLANYITRGREYRVQVQAVADKYSYYLNSELSSRDLTLTYSQVLDVPEFVTDSLNNPITIETNGSKKYYLNFNGVEGAYRYEIMVNFNTKTVLNDNRTTPYKVDITDFLTDINGEVMANSYNITVRALPQEADTITQASKFNSYVYKLRNQLKQVTNIVVSNPDETDGKYVLSFNLQDNAQSYSVEIIKLNDTEYTSYLASLTPKLTLPITNVKGAIDITAYVQQAGEYYIYITAYPGADNSYYDASDRSSEFAVVSKLQTLATPSNLRYNNQSKTEFLIGWTGDTNADSYTIKVTTPKNKEYIYKTNQTTFNINDIITVEGGYKFAVKSVVYSNSESSKSYVSSSYSEECSFTYRYTELKDFERYGVYLFDDTTKYNFAISDVTNLTNLLWYHLLFGVDENYKLNIYIKPQSNETVKQAIIRLADDASNYQLASGNTSIYDFSLDTEWQTLVNASGTSNASLLGYMCRKLLGQYPEMAIVGNFSCESTNENVFNLNFNNTLDVEKIENTTHVNMAKDYANKFKYIDKSVRRNINSVFAIDRRKEMEVSTTEQLFMAVQYGFKPVFVGNCTVAQKVYENAKLVLTAIASANMTDLEKATAIFDWLEFAFNINMDAKLITVGATDKLGTLADYGTRAEFYLDGLFYNIGQSTNGDIVIGSKQATAESLSKAFVLLCGIEGIETRKINGSLLYKDTESSAATGHEHSWNKIKLATTEGEAASWLNVDIAYSDLRYDARTKSNSYNMASHLLFLVSDAYLQSNLNFGSVLNKLSVSDMGEKQIVTLPENKQIGKIEQSYDYYSNTIKSVSFEQLKQTINESFLQPSADKMTTGVEQAENAPSTFGLKYNASSNYRQYLMGEYDGTISRLEAYLLNMLIYGKNLLINNDEKVSSFELRVDQDSSIDFANRLSNLNTTKMNNTYILDSEYEERKYLTINTFSYQDTSTGTITLVVTMRYSR